MFPVFLVYRALLNVLLWDCHVVYLSIVNMLFPYKYYHCSLLCSCDLMVNSAFFDPSNAQSQYALKFKIQCKCMNAKFYPSQQEQTHIRATCYEILGWSVGYLTLIPYYAVNKYNNILYLQK